MTIVLLLVIQLVTILKVGYAAPIDFRLYSAEEIAETIDRWGAHYSSTLLYASTSQADYGLPTAGGADDCPFDDDVDGCLNRFLILNPSAERKSLPHVLWSGELHGNERVGPTAVVEATQLLLQAVECHALPRLELQDEIDWETELKEAHSCRQDLYETYGTSLDIQWLARLFHTRRLIVVPTANALGYFRNVREEDRTDPNRDFPYDTTPDSCMHTVAARTLNELYQDHIVQLSLTFHGGMEVIGYEWGAPTYMGDTSPDDLAQKEIAEFYSNFAGGFEGTRPYSFGAMNDLVYPVHGGMEDWAYAASWDPERSTPCEPNTYGGYDKSRTVYDEYVLRCFNMLVETSENKIPRSHLGTSVELLGTTPGSNGHVTRNLRLALAALELVQPYVYVDSVNEMKLVNDNWKCRHVNVGSSDSVVKLDFVVGGSIHVHDTQIYHRPWSSSLSNQFCEADSIINVYDETSAWMNGTIVNPTSGTIDLSSYSTEDEIAVVVRVRVDQNWRGESHIVNARTNPGYKAEHNGYVIQGNLDWYSVPLLIHRDGTTTEELFVRYDPNYVPADGADDPTEVSRKFPNQETNTDAKARPSDSATFSGWLLVAIIVVAVGIFVSRSIIRHLFRQSRRERVKDFIADRQAVTPGLNGYEDIPAGGEVDLPEIA